MGWVVVDLRATRCQRAILLSILRRRICLRISSDPCIRCVNLKSFSIFNFLLHCKYYIVKIWGKISGTKLKGGSFFCFFFLVRIVWNLKSLDLTDGEKYYYNGILAPNNKFSPTLQGSGYNLKFSN